MSIKAKIDNLISGDFDQRICVGFYVQEHHLYAVVAINHARDVQRVMRLLSAQVQVDQAMLVRTYQHLETSPERY